MNGMLVDRRVNPRILLVFFPKGFLVSIIHLVERDNIEYSFFFKDTTILDELTGPSIFR